MKVNDKISDDVYYNIYSKECEKKIVQTKSVDDKEIYSHIDLSLNRYKNIQFMGALQPISLMNTESLLLTMMKSKSKNLSKFLCSSVPQKVSEVIFSSCIKERFLFSKYFNQTMRSSSKIQTDACFAEFAISFRQLRRLISAYRHVEYLYLQNCKLSIPVVPDFSQSLKNAKIIKLDISESGLKRASDWKINPLELDNLIKGLTTSEDLRRTLIKIRLEDDIRENSSICQILHERGFHKTKVTPHL
ncbi:unnamed protein product [Moneuplotes crassus]|uniref:Uncharacterized protein n=1 Tax=Euplotes crassus TaxID=5936 RepID=A0AAD1XGX5_EUPCR|nr:unnamed protein product [Moneuplotes crassus]